MHYRRRKTGEINSEKVMFPQYGDISIVAMKATGVILLNLIPYIAISYYTYALTGLEMQYISDASRGNIEAIYQYINSGGSINVRNKDGTTALVAAINSGHLDIAKYLLKEGADASLFNTDGDNALISAVKHCYNDLVNDIVLAQPRVINMTDRSYTALMYAASRGNILIAKTLINAGASIKIHGEWGETALTSAIVNNRIEMVKYLLSIGDDPNDHYGPWNTPLVSAVDYANFSIASILLDAGADPNGDCGRSMNLAAELSDISILEMLIQHGANINSIDCFTKNTPLITASEHNNIVGVKYLIKEGANTEIKNGLGMTALMQAIAMKHYFVAAIILSVNNE